METPHQFVVLSIGSRVLCDVEVNNLATIMSEHVKYVQESKSSRLYREEINVDQVRDMIVAKCLPDLRQRFLGSNYVIRYGGLEYLDT